jgi:hypothetical protein
MPWYRLDDVGYDDPLVLAMGNAAYGALTRMGQYASAQRTDGWIPAHKAREICSRAELRALTDKRIGDDPPALHLATDECRCLEGRRDLSRGGFWIHGFLDRNPSRSENDVHRAKARELKDKELRRAVKERDGDRCRYCGITVRWADRKTTAGGVLDHVDPKIASGAANLVVACRGCNSRKKDCTPEAAGMALLPVAPLPRTEADSIYAGSTPDQPPINVGSTDPAQNGSRSGPRSDHRPDPAPDHQPPGETGPDPAQNQVTEPVINSEINSGMTAGPGRGGAGTGSRTDIGRYAGVVGDAGPTGARPTVGPPTTIRDQLAPNPYTRSPAGQTTPPAGPAPPRGDP